MKNAGKYKDQYILKLEEMIQGMEKIIHSMAKELEAIVGKKEDDG